MIDANDKIELLKKLKRTLESCPHDRAGNVLVPEQLAFVLAQTLDVLKQDVEIADKLADVVARSAQTAQLLEIAATSIAQQVVMRHLLLGGRL